MTNGAKCYLNRTSMGKIASALSDCITKPTDLTLSSVGINLREAGRTFLVKTNLFSVDIDVF